MANPLDPDYDPKGYRGSQGRSAKPKLENLIGDAWGQTPGELEYKFAALGLGMEPEELPKFETNADLQVWVFRMHALRGSKEHFQELGDRSSPKPSRLQGMNEKKSTRGATANASQSEQDRWFAGLEAPQESPDDVEDDDLM